MSNPILFFNFIFKYYFLAKTIALSAPNEKEQKPASVLETGFVNLFLLLLTTMSCQQVLEGKCQESDFRTEGMNLTA